MAASQRLTHVLVTLALLILCVLMVLYPAETWHAGVRGLSIWWDVLFPSLFPFSLSYLKWDQKVISPFFYWHLIPTLMELLRKWERKSEREKSGKLQKTLVLLWARVVVVKLILTHFPHSHPKPRLRTQPIEFELNWTLNWFSLSSDLQNLQEIQKIQEIQDIQESIKFYFLLLQNQQQ